MSNNTIINKGDLLLAEPFMYDQHFKRTVTLICEHNEQGSIGLVLNRPSIFKINQMIENFPSFNALMYYGGPVGLDQMNYLHCYGDLIPNSTPIADNIFWNGDYEVLKQLIKNKQIHPHNIKFFIGYAGWDKNQLQEEMKEESWIVCKDYHQIYKMSEYMWQDVLTHMGGKYKLMTNFPENPQLN
ncbi:MAG: YqgE/AlgH family protein [Chitinophagales bacterium]|nr:YqgE/AlgH family protein [Chitinophagales bacterium]